MKNLGDFRLLRDKSGFSLIEAIIGISIASMVLILSLTAYMVTLRSYKQSSAAGKASHAAHLSVEYFVRDALSGNAILQSYGMHETAEDSVIIQSPAYDASGIIANVYDYTIYQLNQDGEFLRTIVSSAGLRTPETERVIASDISELSFEYFCVESFTGTGNTSTFQLGNAWADTPSVTIDGDVVISFSIISATNTIILQSAPPAGALIQVKYRIDPNDASALNAVRLVNMTITSEDVNGDSAKDTVLTASAKLRNKR